jgi:hypothetical protein
MAGALDLAHAAEYQRRQKFQSVGVVKQDRNPPENKMQPVVEAVPENKREDAQEEDAVLGKVSKHPRLAGVVFSSFKARKLAEAAALATADFAHFDGQPVSIHDVRAVLDDV